MQHERVRSLPVCIECCGPKALGLVLCWPCHRQQTNENNGMYGDVLLAALELIEDGKVAVDNAGVLRHIDGRIGMTKVVYNA